MIDCYRHAHPEQPMLRSGIGVPALYCTEVAVDIVSFGDPARDDGLQLFLRQSLYQILQRSFNGAGVAWPRCYREDRGDGMLILLPPCIPTALLVGPVVDQLYRELRQHNRVTTPPGNIRLRMAMHTGYVRQDEHGTAGRSLVHLFRLLEAPAFKWVFDDPAVDFGIIISERLYQDIIQDGLGPIDPAAYRPTGVELKETHARGWVHFPSRMAGPYYSNGEPSAPESSAGPPPAQESPRTATDAAR